MLGSMRNIHVKKISLSEIAIEHNPQHQIWNDIQVKHFIVYIINVRCDSAFMGLGLHNMVYSKKKRKP